jgi:hypothetical protein
MEGGKHDKDDMIVDISCLRIRRFGSASGDRPLEDKAWRAIGEQMDVLAEDWPLGDRP